MVEANEKVNRALTGAALSLGANIEIIDIPGYAPLKNDRGMTEVACEAFGLAFENEELRVTDAVTTGSTDMGDLSCVMPVIHPYAAGCAGSGHSSNYEIADPERACVMSAKWQLAMTSLLLENGAERARRIVAEYVPPFATKEEYFAYVDKLNSCGDRIVYDYENGSATVKM